MAGAGAYEQPRSNTDGHLCCSSCCSAASRFTRKRGGFVDGGEQWPWAGLGRDVAEEVPAGVSVGPVQPPPTVIVAQLGGWPTGPFGSVVFAPRRAEFQDRDAAPAHGAVDAVDQRLSEVRATVLCTV